AGQESLVLRGHAGQVPSAAWRADGRLLATAGISDGTLRLWDLTRTPPRSEVLQLFEAGQPSLRQVAWTPEGRHLATANADGTVYLLRLARPGDVYQVAE